MGLNLGSDDLLLRTVETQKTQMKRLTCTCGILISIASLSICSCESESAQSRQGKNEKAPSQQGLCSSYIEFTEVELIDGKLKGVASYFGSQNKTQKAEVMVESMEINTAPHISENSRKSYVTHRIPSISTYSTTGDKTDVVKMGSSKFAGVDLKPVITTETKMVRFIGYIYETDVEYSQSSYPGKVTFSQWVTVR